MALQELLDDIADDEFSYKEELRKEGKPEQRKDNAPNDLDKKHKKKHGVEPVIIGINWREPDAVVDGIIKAIEGDKPYDERDELTEDELKAFEAGELVF